MKKYLAVFADLDNTILDFDRSEQTAIRQVLKQNGLPHDVETATIYSEINKQYWEAYERGDIPREAIFLGRFRTLVEKMNFDIAPQKLSDDYFYALSAGHDVVYGAVEFLEWLHKNGIAVYATTNGVARTQYRRLRDADLERHFDGVYVSETVGAQKPSVEYFDYILAEIPFNKENILLIGDSPSSDILGGINAGIDTCWYNPKQAETTFSPTFTVKNFEEIKRILSAQNGKE
ncbi:MAG: YjjG family noncanonical pyrimidine nucleotidase [Clostridia bacterium]|nr:YjjG family noncanonical pyrimidine nucleotidase [Clostridia bacterium]